MIYVGIYNYSSVPYLQLFFLIQQASIHYIIYPLYYLQVGMQNEDP